MTVLDASAVAALLFEEPGGGRVADIIASGNAAISAVNFSEVAALLMRRQVPDLVAIMSDLEQQVEIVPFDTEQALQAASIAAITAEQGLGMGDRACLTLARVLQAPAATADRIWKEIADAVGVRVELVRG
jgi:PIN domain nuclease of toxin-antitoxin system